MAITLVNGRVMTDRGLADGLAVRIEGERIAALGPRDELTAGAEVRDLLGARLLPKAGRAAGERWQPAVYLGVETDGSVVVMVHRA